MPPGIDMLVFAVRLWTHNSFTRSCRRRSDDLVVPMVVLCYWCLPWRCRLLGLRTHREKTKTTDEAGLPATPAPDAATDPVAMNSGESRLPCPAGLAAHGTNPSGATETLHLRACSSGTFQYFRLCLGIGCNSVRFVLEH